MTDAELKQQQHIRNLRNLVDPISLHDNAPTQHRISALERVRQFLDVRFIPRFNEVNDRTQFLLWMIVVALPQIVEQALPEVIHIVQPAETLQQIGYLYGVELGSIRRLNDITNDNIVCAGMRLRISGCDRVKQSKQVA